MSATPPNATGGRTCPEELKLCELWSCKDGCVLRKDASARAEKQHPAPGDGGESTCAGGERSSEKPASDSRPQAAGGLADPSERESAVSAARRLDWLPDVIHRARAIVDGWQRGDAFSKFPANEAIDFARAVVELADRDAASSDRLQMCEGSKAYEVAGMEGAPLYVPVCGDHAQTWFTERNHLKGGMDARCIVCAHGVASAIQRPANNWHQTRCANCGATDAQGDDRLNHPCPAGSAR